MRETREFLNSLLDIGEIMLSNGAEVKRVEDTLTRMGMASGAARMNVFVITSSIVVTWVKDGNETYTQTRRINSPGGTDFKKIEDLNALSREYCRKPIPLPELQNRIRKIRESTVNYYKIYTGSILAAGSLVLFFGGNIQDALAGGIFAIFICILQQYFAPVCTNKVFFNFMSSFITGFMILIVARFLPLHTDKVMIGDIMLLIPGMAMTNSVRDVLVGDTITGVMRLIESLLWAVSIAFGFIMAIWMMGV